MRPGEIVLVSSLLIVTTCQRARTETHDATPAVATGMSDARARDASAQVRSAAQPDASSDPSFVTITSFDCEKVFEAPGIPRSVGPINDGISAWRGGGPNGANWNVDDLRCVVAVSTTCSRAKVLVAIRVGTRLVADKKIDVGVAGGVPGRADVELAVAFDRWRKHLDQPLPSPAASQVPYRTAVFRATAQVTCSAPLPASAADWKYPSVTADASFVAGFATGE